MYRKRSQANSDVSHMICKAEVLLSSRDAAARLNNAHLYMSSLSVCGFLFTERLLGTVLASTYKCCHSVTAVPRTRVQLLESDVSTPHMQLHIQVQFTIFAP